MYMCRQRKWKTPDLVERTLRIMWVSFVSLSSHMQVFFIGHEGIRLVVVDLEGVCDGLFPLT